MKRLEKYLLDNKLVSVGAVAHAREFLQSGYSVTEELNNIPEALLLLSETYDGILAKGYNTMKETVVYTTITKYTPSTDCAMSIPFDVQAETRCTILSINDINREVIVGTATDKAVHIERIRSFINNRKPGYNIVIYKLFRTSYHRWMSSLSELIGGYYDDSMIRVSTDESMKTIFRNALELGATDISIEPYQHSTEVWFMVGKMWEKFPYIEFRGESRRQVSNWLMTASDVSASIIHQPLVNSALQNLGGYDTHRGRLNKLKASYGDLINIRVLPNQPEFIDISKLGYSDVVESYLNDLARFRQGIVFFCGEANAGKNTAIFGVVSQITTKKRYKSISLENPIEYLVPKVVQVEANDQGTYERFCESLIRQTPDIVYFSEVSNGFIIDHVLSQAITGNMVFTTLHTKDCANFFNRIKDLNKSNITAQLSSSLIGVVTQKLLPKSCPDCRVELREDQIDTRYIETLAEHSYSGPYYVNTGLMGDGETICPNCTGTKSKGVVPVAEYLDFDNDVQYKIRFAESEAQVHSLIAEELKSRGISILDDALRIMERGDVSIEVLIDRDVLDFKKRGIK